MSKFTELYTKEQFILAAEIKEALENDEDLLKLAQLKVELKEGNDWEWASIRDTHISRVAPDSGGIDITLSRYAGGDSWDRYDTSIGLSELYDPEYMSSLQKAIESRRVQREKQANLQKEQAQQVKTNEAIRVLEEQGFKVTK